MAACTKCEHCVILEKVLETDLSRYRCQKHDEEMCKIFNSKGNCQEHKAGKPQVK